MKIFLYLPIIAAASFATPILTAPSPAHSQQMRTMPNIEHISLNVELAKQAIDATLFIRKHYKDRKFTDADPEIMIGAMKKSGVYAKLLTELRKFGFSNPEQWSKAAVSTAIAVGFLRNGDGKNMIAQMQMMQDDPRMSDDMKAQMVATMNAVMPPQANMNVAQKVLADRSYAVKVDKLLNN